MMNAQLNEDIYRRLAARLDALPNGFPATDDGTDLALLAHLFTPEEAGLALQLSLTPHPPEEIAERSGHTSEELRRMLKSMAKKGLIEVRRTDQGLEYALMPFVVGIYEMQVWRLDENLAALVEAYFKKAFTRVLDVEPQYHRVIPIGETIPVNIEVQPFESAAGIINAARAWGVIDCICRKQKALIGEACGHPIEVCMPFSDVPGAFDQSNIVRALTHDEALATLRMAAEAGLVHTVGNYQNHIGYICNCCTCGCGILRGVAELGMANVVARAPFVSTVEPDLCNSCEACVAYCQFDALTPDDQGIMSVDNRRCVGCGQCVLHCEQDALKLERRPESEIKPVPATMRDWQIERAAARGRDLSDVL